MNLKETYNRIADDWSKDHRSDDWWIEGTDKLASLLKPGDEILDVGCGAGVKSNYLSNKGFRVLGIDFSEKLIEIARREVPQAEFKVLDMKDVSSLYKEFDVVFAQASLLHIKRSEIQSVIKGLVAVLKPGGYLYIAVKGVRPGGKEEEVLKEHDYGYDYERFFSYYSMDELVKSLKDEDLEVVFGHSKQTGRTEWLQIIGKKKER